MKRIGILKYGAGLGLTTLALVAALAVGAFAYFSSTGTGNASAKAGLLSPSSITSTSTGAGTATINWSAVTPPSSGAVKYYVTRNGGAAGGNCPTASAPSTVLTCQDSGLAKGTYSYTVVAVWQSWTSTSAPATSVSVSYGAATQLVFTTQPDGGATGGLAFPTQPVVKAEDAGGNVVTNYTGSVSLAIASQSGTGATLSGCAGTLSNGVTTFTGCKIDKAGTYTLKASDGSLNATSASFAVAVGTASQLVFTTQPDGGATGGLAFPSQPVVTAQDAGGNTVTNYTGSVSLAIASQSGTGATLSGCAGTLSNGVTTFTGCKIDKAGTYTLTAADGTLSKISASFTVAVGTASQLVFTTQPVGAAAGSALATQPKLTVQDAGGNTVTTDSSTVTLSITSGTPTQGGPGTLSGCSQSESQGVISFSGCTINTAGNSYKLHATDGTMTPADSAPFNMTTTAPSVAITYPVNNTTYGTNWTGTITGTAAANGGTNVSNTTVAIDDTTASKWWDGTGWNATSATYTPATGTNAWSLSFPTSLLTPGHSYVVTAKATDSVGNVGTSASVSFTYSAAAVTVLEQDTPSTVSNTFTTPNSIAGGNGNTDLVIIYCYGSPSCASGQTDPTVSGPFVNSGALVPSSSLTVIPTFTPAGNSIKSCIEVVQMTGNNTSAPVTVTLGSNEDVGFVDVVQLSSGAKVQGTPSGSTGGDQTTATTATAGFGSAPAANYAELALVGLTGNSGNDTIAPPSGFAQLGNYQHSSTISGGSPTLGGDLGMYFNPSAQLSANFALSPLAVNWGTIAIQIG